MKSKQTARGVYNNLEDSTYIVTNGDIYLFFSSASRLGRFLGGYHDNRNKLIKKLHSVIGDTNFPYEAIADMALYEQIENKGMLALLDGRLIRKDEIEMYGVECMREKKFGEFHHISNPTDIQKVRDKMSINYKEAQ